MGAHGLGMSIVGVQLTEGLAIMYEFEIENCGVCVRLTPAFECHEESSRGNKWSCIN